MKKLIIPLALVLFITASYFLWQANFYKSSVTNHSQIRNKKPLPKEVTVTLSKDGFSPSTVTIKAGSAVRWKNMSGDKQTVNSDDYPINQNHKELNFGIFNDGSSVVYIFTKPGEYGYHNQLKPEQKGKVNVEK